MAKRNISHLSSGYQKVGGRWLAACSMALRVSGYKFLLLSASE